MFLWTSYGMLNPEGSLTYVNMKSKVEDCDKRLALMLEYLFNQGKVRIFISVRQYGGSLQLRYTDFFGSPFIS